VVHADELDQLLAAVPPDVLVVVDEAYLEFVRDPGAPDGVALLAEHDNVVVLRTLSKAYGLAGLRVGYAIASARLIAGVRAVSTPFGVSHVAQRAALASLLPPAQAELMQRVDALVAERERVVAALATQGWELPESQANFVWFPLGEATMARAAEAREAGVLVRPFAGDGLRVSIGEVEANDAFLEVAKGWRE
jgi:histidinol-phosphate aminotransferase